MQKTKDMKTKQYAELLKTLETRFGSNMKRHKGLEWANVQARLEANIEKLWSLNEMLTEEQYRELQKLGHFDAKTSSWVKTPADIRKLGGALFADFRYGNVFIYHNGAQSYYGVRAFRGSLRV